MSESLGSSEGANSFSASASSSGGRKRVRDTANLSMFPVALGESAMVLDPTDGDPMHDDNEYYDMDMEDAVNESRDIEADADDNDITAVATAAARSMASMATAPAGTPYYLALGAADLDEEYDIAI